MMIYIDTDYKCNLTNVDGIYRGFETAIFDGKCKAFIEGCRYIPVDESWTREDGKIFKGEAMAPFVNSRLLEAYQKQYEVDAVEREALEILIGTNNAEN